MGTSDTASTDFVDSGHTTVCVDTAMFTSNSKINDSFHQDKRGSTDHPLLDGHTQQKQMILMRGLPSCGKTTTARRLTSQDGVHIEFDEFFYTQVGEDPIRYDWSAKLLPSARRWNYERVKKAIKSEASPIVVDSDNSPDATTRAYVKLALYHNYQISFMEPEVPWWREIRALLNDKQSNRKALKSWAQKLVLLSQGTHRVPLETFLRRIDRWENLTIATILSGAQTSTG